MKIKGQKIQGFHEVEIFIPRKDSGILFKAKAIESYDEFEKLCNRPKPPKFLRPGGVRGEDLDDPVYLKNLEEWATKRMAYTIIASLSATEGLEWDKVALSNPETWHLYETDLRESGFTEYEIARIVKGVVEANALDDRAIDEGRRRFLASQSVDQPQ